LRASPDVEKKLGVSYADLDELLRTADIVSLHLPLLPQTQGIINAARIAAMKPGAVLINCARGGLVDEAALVDALKAGRLFGAGIDAFSVEPPAGSPLLELENTVVTSHLAGATLDNFAGIVGACGGEYKVRVARRRAAQNRCGDRARAQSPGSINPDGQISCTALLHLNKRR